MRHRLLIGFAVILFLVASWPSYEAWRVSRFRRVRIGMTRSEVLQVVGRPTSASAQQCLEAESCEPGDCWLYRQRMFEHLVVHFDANGHVACVDVYRPEIRQSG